MRSQFVLDIKMILIILSIGCAYLQTASWLYGAGWRHPIYGFQNRKSDSIIKQTREDMLVCAVWPLAILFGLIIAGFDVCETASKLEGTWKK